MTQTRLKIYIIGKNGQLGQSLLKLSPQYPQYQFTFLNRTELDLSQPNKLNTMFKKAQKNQTIDFIINCAADTTLEKAETEKTKALADTINHLAVEQLAKIALAHQATLIHISTDYVFNGQHFKPYTETDTPDPQNIYGHTKLKGEQAIQTLNPKGCILRTGWLYSEFRQNFVKTMLRLGQTKPELNVIYDQIGTPTYAGDLAQTIMKIIQSQHNHTQNQLYHFSNEGLCSWYDFANTIFEMAHITCKTHPIETKDYPTHIKRPHYSVLNKTKIKQHFGINIPYWKDSLKQCLTEIPHHHTTS